MKIDLSYCNFYIVLNLIFYCDSFESNPTTRRLINGSWKNARAQKIRTLLEDIQNRVAYIETYLTTSRRAREYSLTSPETEWFNIYSIYRSNQQLNEACNKLWATAELFHATNPEFLKRVSCLLGNYSIRIIYKEL